MNLKNRYIVSVSSLSCALRVFSAEGISVSRLFPFISAVGVTVKSADIAALSDLPPVKTVHADCRVSALGTEADAPKETDNRRFVRARSGGNVTVAVIDTGVAEHPDLTLFPSRIAAFVDFVNGRKTPYDDNGHGTAVAGILCGSNLLRGGYPARRARGVRIAALKALSAAGEGSAFDILTAMQWVYSNREKYNIKVVNMSLGGRPQKGSDPLALGAETLVANGITVVASAGNGAKEGEGVLSPGISPYVITVGGTDGEREADFSARGNGKPDILAPAVGVETITPHGGYTRLSGTSMAAPRVSAAVAELLMAHPSYTPARVKSALKSYE